MRGLVVPLLAPVAVLGLLFAASRLDLSQRFENVTVDQRFKAREPHDPPVDPRILLVGISEYSLQKVGRWQDWTREVHALFLDRLALRTPSVVAYDFLFTEVSKNPELDQTFASQLARFGGAITGSFVEMDPSKPAGDAPPQIGKTRALSKFKGDYTKLVSGFSGAVPIPAIAESSWTGFVNTPPSQIDGTRRKIPLVVGYQGHVYPTLVLQSLIQFEGISADEVEVRLGKEVILSLPNGEARRIPIDEQGAMYLNYRGREAFKPYDYIQLMQRINEFADSEKLPDSMPPVDGQILLIGQVAEGLSDFGTTPFSPLEPLVLVQAVALNTILQSDYLRIVPLWQILLGWLPVAWGTLFLLRKSSVFWGSLVPFLIVVTYIFACFVLFRMHSWQLPLVLPVAGFILVNGYALTDRILVEMRAKSRIRNVFGTFAPRPVVDAIIASGEDPRLGGEKVEITAFFSDIQGFSTFSEMLEPEPLVELMNEYLTAMTNELMARLGTLDKYIGDAIVGMFGAPLPSPDHAHRACCAAIEMQRRQAELREKWRHETRWPEIVWHMQTRIGLNTGLAVVGQMGSPSRMNYTMTGDTVNLAARCESGAKSYGVYTMVTGETRNGSRAAQDDIVFRYLDKVVVQGRSEPAEFYEVLGFACDTSQTTRDCIEIYQEGIASYFARDWDRARKAFERSSELEPHRPGFLEGVKTNPSLVMIARAAAMKANPPSDDWDGRYVMTSK